MPSRAARLPAQNVATLTGKTFFPHLISQPFHHGLVVVFLAAAIMAVIAAIVSAMRGSQYYHGQEDIEADQESGATQAPVSDGAGSTQP